jgi:hypothetical protein
MAAQWYVHDLAGQHGPLGPAELRQRLESYTDTKDVFVWREGFQQWKPATEAFDPNQVLQPAASGALENQPSGLVPLTGSTTSLREIGAASFLSE